MELDSAVGYCQNGTYQSFVQSIPCVQILVAELLWHKDISLNVNVVAWRLLRNRLSTKDKIFRWCILDQDSQLCVSRCGASESANHLFLNCHFFTAFGSMVGIGLVSLCWILHVYLIILCKSAFYLQFKSSTIFYVCYLVFLCMDILERDE